MDTTQQQSDFIFYKDDSGQVNVSVILEGETVWATQKSLAEIFGVKVNTINYHLKEIFKSGELEEDSVIRKIRITAQDGKKYKTKFYNLDAIISVGYRVNSFQATQFRIWATKVLREYLIKGFAMDDHRLKQGKQLFGKDYFSELLERIKEIRASERRFYQKLTDLYAQCSVDYNPDSPVSRRFYATVQNKFHYAITGKTAGEIIKTRVNADQENMGLTYWKNAPAGKILKSDISVAKNYYHEIEMDNLNHLVGMYLDYAENQARRHTLMKMSDWVKKLDGFLQFNEYELLKDGGKISKKIAETIAEREFEKFRVFQDRAYQSDFDQLIDQMNEKDRKTQ